MRSEAIFRAALAFLAGSDAALITVNLEDLWGEVEPQNIPGTGAEEPNWRRRAAQTLEQLFGSDTALATLRMLSDLRPAGPPPAETSPPPMP